jgi:hypothetical protein
MSQQDNFIGGFLAGTVVGGIVGGILGTLVATRLAQKEALESGDARASKLESKPAKKRQLKPPTEQSIETARQGLEDKIAQLNEAIDDVRQQLGGVNGVTKAREIGEPTTPQDF